MDALKYENIFNQFQHYTIVLINKVTNRLKRKMSTDHKRFYSFFFISIIPKYRPVEIAEGLIQLIEDDSYNGTALRISKAFGRDVAYYIKSLSARGLPY